MASPRERHGGEHEDGEGRRDEIAEIERFAQFHAWLSLLPGEAERRAARIIRAAMPEDAYSFVSRSSSKARIRGPSPRMTTGLAPHRLPAYHCACFSASSLRS